MPEGPELAIAASYIRRVCSGKVFSKIRKSAVTKCADIPWIDGDKFSLSAKSRGKELMISIDPIAGNIQSPSNSSPKFVLFHFGMSGRFAFTPVSAAPKHSHLSFITDDDDDANSLHFVDTRRFGRWESKMAPDEWTEDRGPCALTEFPKFRQNLVSSIESSVFDRPLCEAMLDQRFFNGIGNYLRAEIMFRAKAPPFDKARDILRAIFEQPNRSNSGEDLVTLCRVVQEEVVALQSTAYTSSDHYLTDNDKTFDQWLKCYGRPQMSQLRDANKRMVWYSGPAGSLAKKAKERADGLRKRKKTTKTAVEEVSSVDVKETKTDTSNRKETPDEVNGRAKSKKTVKKTRTTVVKEPNGKLAKQIKSETEETEAQIANGIGIMTRRRSSLLKSALKS